MQSDAAVLEPWTEDAATREAERLCSRFVCRLSGAPADGVERLRAPRTTRLVRELDALRRALAERRESISDLLFHAVGAQDDRSLRNAILKAKRDLYNLRPVSPDALDAACAALAPDAAADVRAFAQTLAREAELHGDVARAYAEESGEARERFRALLGDGDFRKGLLISSRSLLGALERYAGGAQDEKTERGLLRYLTRMSMKATPFSTFCAIIGGRFTSGDGEADGGSVIRIHGDPRRKRSYVRINKMLYGILLEHLKSRPDVRRALEVEPNPTLRGEKGRLVFLTALEGREVFQRVPANDVLALITGAFRDRGRPTLGELIDTLCTDPRVEATPDEATAYLDKLLDIGFVRFHTGIREQDADWDLPFRALLGRIDDPHAARAAELLARLRERTEAYAAAGAGERAAIVDELLSLVSGAMDEMEVKARPRKDMPFYEDATADAEAEVSLAPGMRRAADTFAGWVRATSHLAWPRAEQATMRHFFDGFYGDSAGIPLLQFYEDFYREHFKAHVEKEQKRRAPGDTDDPYDAANPFGLDFVTSLADARTRLAEHVQEHWRTEPDAEEIRISLADVERILGEVEPSRPVCRSISAFVTAARREDGDPALILQGGSYTAGYGKYFSRFLYMLPDEMQREVREGNAALTGEHLAEICGDAQFNANLHPPLLRWEISYPTGESGHADEQLPSSTLLVGPDPDDAHALCLRHATTGRRVVPVDLGFLNPRMRPPLYQLLSRFTRPTSFAPSLPETPTGPVAPPRPASPATARVASTSPDGSDDTVEGNAVEGDAERPASPDVVAADAGEEPKAVEAPRVKHRPRISVDGRVVLARRRWTVPGEIFPQRRADESAADFFVRANLWRIEAGLPETAYLRIVPLPVPPKPKTGDAAAEATPVDAADSPDSVDTAVAAEEQDTPTVAEDAVAEEATDGAGEKAEAAKAKKVTAGSRDLVKPQFMDFASPLLVGLLGKMGANLTRYNVVVEERLPGRDDLPRYDGEAYVAEMVMQIDFPEEAVIGANETAEDADGER